MIDTITASKNFCHEANPVLWNAFCALTGRPIGEPNYLWTEHDVVVALLARGLGDHDTGTNDSDNGESGAIKQRRRFNIGRDIQTGDVVAVGQTPYPTNARIFVIGA